MSYLESSFIHIIKHGPFYTDRAFSMSHILTWFYYNYNILSSLRKPLNRQPMDLLRYFPAFFCSDCKKLVSGFLNGKTDSEWDWKMAKLSDSRLEIRSINLVSKNLQHQSVSLKNLRKNELMKTLSAMNLQSSGYHFTSFYLRLVVKVRPEALASEA